MRVYLYLLGISAADVPAQPSLDIGSGEAAACKSLKVHGRCGALVRWDT